VPPPAVLTFRRLARVHTGPALRGFRPTNVARRGRDVTSPASQLRRSWCLRVCSLCYGRNNKAKVERDKELSTSKRSRHADERQCNIVSNDIALGDEHALESIELSRESNQLIEALNAPSAENHWDRRFPPMVAARDSRDPEIFEDFESGVSFLRALPGDPPQATLNSGLPFFSRGCTA
jgi:hypothetical protein